MPGLLFPLLFSSRNNCLHVRKAYYFPFSSSTNFFPLGIFGEQGTLVKNWVCDSFGKATCNVSRNHELVNFSDVYLFTQNILARNALFPCSLRTKNSRNMINSVFLLNNPSSKCFFFSKTHNLFLSCRNWKGLTLKNTIQYKQRHRKRI